jgi:ABC-type nitrate/sulfonate/bicarbonate transport system substrate-binding protein
LRGLVSADFVPLFAADKIRIAVANFNVSFMSAGVAAKKGYFKDEGLEPEIIAMRPPVSITALVSSDIDDTTVLGSVVRAALRGLPVRVVASFIDGAIPESGLRLIIDQGRAEANITREVSSTEVANLTPLREAQKELGIKGR